MNRVETYSNIHSHDFFSLLDGHSSPKEILQRCNELGIKSVATTNHGNEFSFYYFAKLQKDFPKIKILYGVEFYEAFNHLEKDNNNRYFHLVVLAKNQEGIKNIHELITKSNFEGFYYKPRIDLEQLKPYSKNLIISSACIGSKLGKYMNNYDKCIEFAKEYKDIFKENFYLEMQVHQSKDQIKYNKIIKKLSYDLNIPYIITNDNHYISKEKQVPHSYFVNINKKNRDVENMGEIYDDCYIHSIDEIYTIMQKSGLSEDEITVGLENTNTISDLCNGKVKFGNPELPHINIPPQYKTEEEWFKSLIVEGWKRKIEPRTKQGLVYDDFNVGRPLKIYKDRLLEEFNTMKEMGFLGYHLIIADYVKDAKRKGIAVADGRGSSAGSLVNYLLDITGIDPIPYGLLFSRYINKERISMPDIDSDFQANRRYEVFDYIKEKYGKNKVSQIINFTYITPKVAIKDAGRCSGKSRKDMDALAEFMTQDSIDESIENFKNNNKLLNLIKEYPDVIELAKEFDGRPRSLSINACFLGDELVMTNHGYKKIKNISVNDMVLTHTNTFKKVIRTIINKSDEIYKLKISNTLPIHTTKNHPFLVRKKTYGIRRKRQYSNPEWKFVNELDKSYMMGIAINNNSNIPNNKIKLPYNNKNFWWVIGRYMGDGWCEYVQSQNNKKVIICCDKTNNIELKEIQNYLNGLFEYRCENSRTTYKIYITKEKNKLFDYLQQFGKYAYGKKLTNDILDLPIDLLKSFLNGYLSADGYYDKKNNVYEFKTVSKELALGISACVNKVYKRHCGISIIKPCVEYIERRKVFSKEKYLVRFTKDNRKKDKAFYENGHIWTPLKKIKIIKKEENTYNLTVLDDNSYTINNIIVHNCGTVITSKPIYEYCGMLKGDEGEPLLQVDKKIAEELGMVKMDLLSTKVLQLISDTMKKIGKNYYDVKKIPLDDKETYEFLAKGNLYGVFQLESYNMTKFFTKLKSKNIMDICAGISLYRPASIKFLDDYIKFKNNPKLIKYYHKDMGAILNETYSIIVYQEQIMFLLQALAKFSFAHADLVRRGIGKKNMEYILEQKEAFIFGDKEKGILGCVNNGLTEKQAREIFAIIESAGEYCFNKSHGLSYSLLTYYTAHLKCHYPLEFMTSLLSLTEDNTKISMYLTECKNLNVNISHPIINKSDFGFKIYKKSLLYGFNSLNNVGIPTIKQIINKRPYVSFEDFLEKNVYEVNKEEEIKLNKSALISLVNSGCFDDLPFEKNSNKKATRKLMLGKIFFDITKQIKKVTTSNIIELFDNSLIDEKQFEKEKIIYELHKKILKKKNVLDLFSDNDLVVLYKEFYSQDSFEIKNKKLNIIEKQYKKQYENYLKDLKRNLKENSKEYTIKINKNRVINNYLNYRGTQDDADLEFESTSFYFQDSWLKTTKEKYGVDEYSEIPSLNMKKVGYYKKKQLYTIVGVLTGKEKKHREIILLTNSGIVICKLGDILYNTVASDLSRGDKIALSGYVGDGFFRAEYYENGKSNKLRALKVLNK